MSKASEWGGSRTGGDEDVAQELALLELEGRLPKTATGKAALIRRIKREQGPNWRDRSIDAQIGKDGSAFTLHDVITGPGLLPKRRKRIGRPRTRSRCSARCAHCGETFYYRKDRWRLGRFCSRDCALAWCRNARRKLPVASEVIRLYVECQWSTPRIARHFGVSDPHTVRAVLVKLGVPRRRHTTASVCREQGCGKPILRIRHAGNGSVYGTRCRHHRGLHYAMLNRERNRRINSALNAFAAALVEPRKIRKLATP